MSFFAKFRRKLRSKNFEAHFLRKLRTLENAQMSKSEEQLSIMTNLAILVSYMRFFVFFIRKLLFYIFQLHFWNRKQKKEVIGHLIFLPGHLLMPKLYI